MNDSSLDIVMPFSENEQILTAPDPESATTEVRRKCSIQILIAGFINYVKKFY